MGWCGACLKLGYSKSLFPFSLSLAQIGLLINDTINLFSY